MLTQKARYALQGLRVLAEAGAASAAPGLGRSTLPIHEIADRANAPRKFLEAILLDLRRHGFVESARGKSGGYALARRPEQIALSDVIRAVDGPLAPIPCASLTAFRPCSDCPDPANCTLRRVMREVRDATAAVLDRRTVADLAGLEGVIEARERATEKA